MNPGKDLPRSNGMTADRCRFPPVETGGSVSRVILPPRLRPGAHVRVVAAARSLAMIGPGTRAIADERFAALGLELSFGRHVEERDDFVSSSIRSRVEDIHDAFSDESVTAVLTVIGGFNSHQLLPHLNWDLLRENPKILCGFSDITALQNAVLARTGVVTYSGPHYSSFGMRDYFDDTLDWFVQCLFTSDEMELEPASVWTDDEEWFLDQDDRHPRPNEGWWVLNSGSAEGRLVGGNAVTFAVLNGTPYQPDLADTVLFLEDDYEAEPHHFDRSLTSILQQPGADRVRGLVVGRFQLRSGMTRELLTQIVENHPVLRGVPVLANVDFGHTSPTLTLPIGGTVQVEADDSGSALRLTVH